MRPKHFMSCLITSVAVTLVIISLYGDTEAYEALYVRRAKGMAITIIGESTTTFEDVTKIRCAFECTKISCISFTWQGRTCVIIFSSKPQLAVGIMFKKLDGAPETYVRSNYKKFVVPLPYNTTLTWNMAQAECVKIGGNLHYSTDFQEMSEAATYFGSLYVGVFKVGGILSSYTTLDGEDVSVWPWDALQPDFEAGPEHCVMVWKNGGYDDIDCDGRLYTTYPDTALCTYNTEQD